MNTKEFVAALVQVVDTALEKQQKEIEAAKNFGIGAAVETTGKKPRQGEVFDVLTNGTVVVNFNGRTRGCNPLKLRLL